MALITSGTFSKALWPGVKAWYGASYMQHKPEYPAIFKKYTSRKAFEEDVGIVGFGLAPVKPEAAGISFSEMQQGFINRYTHVTYALGFIISKEAQEDNQYLELARRRSESLAFSMRQTKETVAANILNRAFNNNYLGGDSVEMCADDHVNKSGGTWANELASAADMSESALEQACIDIGKYTNDKGLKIAVLPQSIIIPVELDFITGRVLKSTLQPDSGEHNLNILKATNRFPGGVHINHYLTDADAFFIITNCPDGMKYYERRPDTLQIENDFNTTNAKYASSSRYSFGWTDPRGIFGSPGA